MTTFAATHSADVKSRAVDTLTYNENTRELVIDWHDDLYKYSGVPLETYQALVAGTYKNGLTDASVGRAAQRVKKDFGPGTYLGKFGDVSFVKDTTKATATFPLAAQPATLSSSRTAPVASTQATSTFSLTPSPAAPAASDGPTYTVDFKDASGERKEYTPKGVNSVDEAVAAIDELSEILGVEFTVTGVYVDFDGEDE